MRSRAQTSEQAACSVTRERAKTDVGTQAVVPALSVMHSLVTLKFLCPATKGEIEYHLKADARVLVDRWRKNLQCKCPYCKSLHNFSFRAGYVEGAIAHIGGAELDTKSLARFISR
jgi:hypothetical protein